MRSLVHHINIIMLWELQEPVMVDDLICCIINLAQSAQYHHAIKTYLLYTVYGIVESLKLIYCTLYMA